MTKQPKQETIQRLLIVTAALLQLVMLTSASTRKYYIAAVERDWDYAPNGMNKVKGIKLDDDSDASVFATRTSDRIGRVYRKVLYREFEDESFEKEKPHSSYLGFLGPLLIGEVGDTIEVLFKNKATREYSMHPHGVFYDKKSEGALYEDKTSGTQKKDDHVKPGDSHVYSWVIKENHAPAEGDDNCLTWMYHSHVVPSKDTNTGLIGPLLTCKKGILVNGKRNDVDKDFIALFTVLDENLSWLLDENIRNFAPDAASKKDDEDFQESNKMHAINGYFYGNLPDVKVCLEDRVSWHLFGIGNEVDLHTAYFHGQTFQVDSHRKDVATILPATFVTATMTAHNPGTWMLNCLVDDHYNAGMYALFSVDKCSNDITMVPPVSGGKLRRYYIAADEVMWDYGPSGFNNMTGKPLTEAGSASEVFFAHGADRIGGKYWKALYVEYTDATFTKKKEKKEHLGFLGPVIRAEVGDTIEVVFKNNASHNYSIQPHGVFFNKSNEGALYKDNTTIHQKRDDVIQPGETFTYRWTVPEHVGPTNKDAQCVTWMYSSAVDPVKDTFSGLIGPLLTCKKGTLTDSGQQKNFDKEFFLLFTVTDENNSWYIDQNKKLAGNPSSIKDDDEDFAESNTMHGINGFLYGNLPGLSMCKGEKVSWHLIGLGNEVDIHGAYFHGNTFMDNDNRKDTVNLLPGTFATLQMTPDNPGIWAIVCKTNDHYSAGMQARYEVSNDCQKGKDAEMDGKVRRYYIAAVERVWDYAPSGKNELVGKRLKDDDDAKVFTAKGEDRIGRKYKKALFREFTDATFTKEKTRTRDSELHLGVLGPMIHAEVGDTIEVLFKNNAAKQTYSMHPNGLLYEKKYEGSNYKDQTQGDSIEDNGIAPGKTFRYIWKVPERSGPSEGDTDCLTWAYFSDVNPIKDTNSGLVGPLIVCRKGELSDENTRKDVDREFSVFFSVLDENESWYLDDNINKYCLKPGSVDKESEEFQESNKMHGINGYVFGNMPGLKMTQNEKVEWYLIGLGNEVDMHTVHFHGQTFLKKSVSYHREDVYDLFPGTFATLEMKPDSVGTWMLHCHVNDHMTGGMIALFEVGSPSGTGKPPHSGSVESAKRHLLHYGVVFIYTLIFYM